MSDSTGRFSRLFPAAGVMLLAFALALGAACRGSDKVAPADSTIVVAATPTTIVKSDDPNCNIIGGGACGTAQVVATVYSKAGVPQEDQDVRFSATAGLLFKGTFSNPEPAANIPIRTDSIGNATVFLATSTTTTVTARSGNATGDLTLNTVQGNISEIQINLDTESPGCEDSTDLIESCSQEVCFKATAIDTNGDPIAGVTIIFKLQNNTSGNDTFNASFTPSQDTTDDNGDAFTVLRPQNDCPTECGGGKSCQGEVIASLQGNAFTSTPHQLTINIQ
ncbi:MAG TPA: hypothetical protein VFW45_16535 [Candidatus Polarisedimenticolia bacterium]|nr:hypothetical protein [Candidatus Polarisedimenticolia bacterium]